MVIRGYLSGHADRLYKSGARSICGVKMPDGLVSNQKFDEPIITPSTKADFGHDEDISKSDILKKNILSIDQYEEIEKITHQLFERGTKIAEERGLILVDTKYEFGYDNQNRLYLIDEIHTPDSSRYFYAKGYQERLRNGEPQKQLSKEFVRQWLIENGFQGKDGQSIPHMSEEYCKTVSEIYIELFEYITDDKFIKEDVNDIVSRVEKNILKYLSA